MNNPISEKARGIIYVVAIVTSGIGVVVTPVLATLNVPNAASIVAAVVAGIGGTAAVLARANLTSPTIGLTEAEVERVAARVWELYKSPAVVVLPEVNPDEQEAQAQPTDL